MPNLSESVFYGISNTMKSDNSFFKLNDGSTKRILRSTRPRLTSGKKSDQRQMTSKKEILCKPSSSSSYDTHSKKIKLEITTLCHDSELSNYEKQIQNNIAERMKFLEDLNIFDAKKSVEESIKLARIKPNPQKKVKIENNQTPNTIRKSVRLQHLDAVKYIEPIEINSEFHEEEISRPSPGPADLLYYYKQENVKGSSTFLSNLMKSRNFVKGEVDSCWNESEEMVEKTLTTMKCGEKDVVKVIPSSICSIAFHPSVDKPIAFVGGKRGELGIFDVENVGLSCFKETSFYYNVHCEKVTCMTVDINNRNILYTTSMDGTVRKLDLVTFQSEQIYSCKEDAYLTYHSQQDINHLLVTGSHGCIDLMDLRCFPLNAQNYKATSNCNVKVVAVNPTQNQYFSTGGSDGYVRLWDLRNMKKDLCELSVGRSINGLEYTPITGKYLLTTSYQDIRIFESPSPWKMIYKNKIRHNNMTGRWLRPFRASWLPRSENLFVIGSMDNPRRIEVWNSDGHLIHSFFGDALQSVSCINTFHPSKKILLGGNSSGRVHIFR